MHELNNPRADYDLSELKILLVDDNENMRSMVKSILYTLGARTINSSEDGDSAFTKMRTNPPDIIICDWVMKPISGPMFVKRIRRGKDSPNVYVPIIMLTAYADMEKVLASRDLGVNEFLVKPISAKNLYRSIKAVIENEKEFVKTDTYFGPDRRRVVKTSGFGEDRRSPVIE